MKRFAMSVLLAGSLLALLPAAVFGHAEYESSDPADKAVLTEQPAQIGATFTERVKPKQSSLKLKSPDGDIIATGGVPAGGKATTMVISDVPALDPGVYTVIWATVALDGDGLKGSFTFTLEAAASAEPSAEPSASPSQAPSPSPSVAPSPTAASSPTTAPTASTVPSASASPVVAPSAATDTGSPASGSDSNVGLLAAVLVVVAVVAVGTWLYRRRAV